MTGEAAMEIFLLKFSSASSSVHLTKRKIENEGNERYTFKASTYLNGYQFSFFKTNPFFQHSSRAHNALSQ